MLLPVLPFILLPSLLFSPKQSNHILVLKTKKFTFNSTPGRVRHFFSFHVLFFVMRLIKQNGCVLKTPTCMFLLECDGSRTVALVFFIYTFFMVLSLTPRGGRQYLVPGSRSGQSQEVSGKLTVWTRPNRKFDCSLTGSYFLLPPITGCSSTWEMFLLDGH